MSDMLDAHLAACEQALARADAMNANYSPPGQYAAMPSTDDLRAVLHEARQAAALRALVPLVTTVDRLWNRVDETDLNNDPTFDDAMAALHFWRQDNWSLAADGSST